MKNIAVLGSTGMIGSGVVRVLADSGLQITEFNREGRSTLNSPSRAKSFEVKPGISSSQLSIFGDFDYVLNFIGIIRHRIKNNSAQDVAKAVLVNSQFPSYLDEAAIKFGFQVIQIGTDCVYSGSKGNYLESDTPDPMDPYGFTKVLGEIGLNRTSILRVSVVGHELSSGIELMDWLLTQPQNAELKGFQNHIWNGVTPLQLAKILSFILRNDLEVGEKTHIVPGDKISKYEMIRLIAQLGGRPDITIQSHLAAANVDRSLSTSKQDLNKEMWRGAGYAEPPSIKDMIKEYFEWTDLILKPQGVADGK